MKAREVYGTAQAWKKERKSSSDSSRRLEDGRVAVKKKNGDILRKAKTESGKRKRMRKKWKKDG